MAAHRATLEFSYAEPAVAATVERAVSLDAGEIEGDRAEATVRRDDTTGGTDAATAIVVDIDAADPKALRAAKRTWCSHVAAAEETALAAR